MEPRTSLKPTSTFASALTSGASPTSSTATIDMGPLDPKPKYHLQSDLEKSIGVTEVEKKIMNIPITLSIKEFLTVSPERSEYIHE